MPAVPSAGINCGQTAMTGSAVQIVGSRADRKRLTLIMQGTVADTFIGQSSAVTSSNGALLAGVKGQTIVLETQAAVFGNGTALAVVGYIEEFG